MGWWEDKKEKAQNTVGDVMENPAQIFDPVNASVIKALEEAGVDMPTVSMGSIFGEKDGGPGDLNTTAEMQALQDLAEEYASSVPEEFQDLGGYDTVEQGQSALAGIESDPRFSAAEIRALDQLETMSDEGLTATDRAQLAKVQGGSNRNLQGQMGAIKQGMQSRGISGSGLDLMSQQNAAQAAAERQAYSDLEIAGQGQRRRESATMNLGQLGSQLGAQDFDRQARKARAQDTINRFNTQNTNQANRYNQGVTQRASDKNVGARNMHTQNAYNARTGAAGQRYDENVDQYNREELQSQQANQQIQDNKEMVIGMGTTVAGMYAHGGKIPEQGMDYAEGGTIPGETNGIDSYADDTVGIMVQPGEIVIPETVAQSPHESAEFVAQENGQSLAGTMVGNPNDVDDEGNDIVGMFIKTVANLSKKGRV
tara:strand:- start:3062 stop:4339 length:1278 start_codon:yes stop_codon:yes gene_type:complete